MPLGGRVLNTLQTNTGRRALNGVKLSIQSPVSLRSECPTIIDGSAYYAAVVAQLVPGDTFTPIDTLALRYLDDVFYWAMGTAAAARRLRQPAN
jgi:hypothetical protein